MASKGPVFVRRRRSGAPRAGVRPLAGAALAAGLALGLTAGCGAGAPPEDVAYDILIVNARVVDGTGAPWYRADVGIRGDRIAAVGPLQGAPAARVIDAAGRVVAPGFVDMMGQSSLRLIEDPPSAESKLRQGITTMLVGEGSSPAPRTAMDGDAGAQDGQARRWTTYAEYFAVLDAEGMPLNAVHNVGATQVRRLVLGDEDVQPSPAQLDEMRGLVKQAMRDGAVGLSTALIYPPAAYATTEELIALAEVAARYGGVYFSHIRNESGGLLEALAEAIRIGEEAGLPAHIYHLKAAGQENWPLMADALDMIQAARDRGVDVTADIYPYVRNGIGLRSFLHPRHYAEGASRFMETLHEPEVRQTLRREVETTSDWENWYRHVGMDWDNVLLVSARGDYGRLVGRSIAEAAVELGRDAWDAFFDLVLAGASVAPLSMDEAQKHMALRAPFVSIDTDAGPVNPERTASAHPRAFGAFPRVIAKYVREDSVLSLEAAVHRMSALGANRLGLYDRGRIAPGLAADLVLFDPETIRDVATFEEPLQQSEGIDYLLVNGVPVIDDGQLTGARPGRALRHGRAGATPASIAWNP